MNFIRKLLTAILLTLLTLGLALTAQADPPSDAIQTMVVEATAYTYAAPGGDINGTGDNITATGTQVRPGVIAVDPKVIPYGTQIYIEGMGHFVAEDTGGAIRGNRIDIFMETEEAALSFGRQTLTIHVSKWGTGRVEYTHKASWAERQVAGIIALIPNYIMNKLGLYDPIELVYMVDVNIPQVNSPPSQADLPYWHTFNQEEMEAVSNFYDTVMKYVPIWAVVAVVLLAIFALYNIANPESKLGAMEYLLGIILFMVLIKFGLHLITFVFDAHYALVQQFRLLAEPFFGNTQKPFSFIEMIMLASNRLTIGDAIIALITALCIGVINFQYILRKLNIAILVGLIPIVCIVAITPAKRQVISIWLKEFITNVFLQSAHAAVLAFSLLMISSASSDMQGFWVKLVTLLGLAGMTNLVRNVIGASTVGKTPAGKAMGAMFGVAGLAAIGGMFSSNQARVQEESPGTVAGRIGTGIARASMITTGVLAGGMMVRAATGDPTMGIGLGGTAGAKGAQVLPGSARGSAKNTPNKYRDSRTDDNISKASEKVFGRNVAGRQSPYASRHAREARAYIDNAKQDLARARTQLENYKPTFNRSQARYTELRNLYGPRAQHLRKLKKEVLPQAEKQLDMAEQKYLSMINIPEEAQLYAHEERLQAAKQTFEEAQSSFDLVWSEIETGVRQYENSVGEMQTTKTEHAFNQQVVFQAEQRLTQENLIKEFTKIKQKKPVRGSIDDAQWSHKDT